MIFVHIDKFLPKSQLYSRKLGLESDHNALYSPLFSRAIHLMVFDCIADLGF